MPWAHLNLAVELYGNRIRGLQLVHADKRGQLALGQAVPGRPQGGQPVLGLTGAARAPQAGRLEPRLRRAARVR